MLNGTQYARQKNGGTQGQNRAVRSTQGGGVSPSLQLVLSAYVAPVKCRPVLHHCVVIYFWSSGFMECMLFTFENRVPLMRKGVSVV